MRTKELVGVWDTRHDYSDGNVATVGVNWSAVGPVTSATARRFAKEILKAADKAEKRIAQLKKLGKRYEFENPEKIH